MPSTKIAGLAPTTRAGRSRAVLGPGPTRSPRATAAAVRCGAVQVGSIGPALPKPARCGSQHLQLSTPSHLPIHTADLPGRSYRTVARCRRTGM